MKAIFNNNLVDTPLPIMPDNRAFQYGDGIFETIWFRNGSAPLLEFHQKRLSDSAEVLKLDIRPIEIKFLEENIETLRELNYPGDDEVVAKIMFWRHASGRAGYWADHRSTDSLLVVRPYKSLQGSLNIDVCNSVAIGQYPWSSTKNLNALPYVMASMECRDKGKDELILFNQNGQAAEGITSNLFVMISGHWYTPSLESGCVAGTMRAFILENSVKLNIPIKQKSIYADELDAATSMILTRATGLAPVAHYKERKLDESPSRALIKAVHDYL